jgi:ribosomal RNA assembly protein
MEQIVCIPEERTGLVVGRGGKTKKELEKAGKVRLKIEEGSVTVKGDSLRVMKAAEVVKAFGLGFSKAKAFDLLRDDQQLVVFNLGGVVPESQFKRLCGRIIGEHGKVRLRLEKQLNVGIRVLDDRVAAIGAPAKLQILREVLDRLLTGATHASAYKHLDRRLASLDKI